MMNTVDHPNSTVSLDAETATISKCVVMMKAANSNFETSEKHIDGMLKTVEDSNKLAMTWNQLFTQDHRPFTAK
jgi:hypothetical protein